MYQEEINKKWQQIHEFQSLLNRTDYPDHCQHDEPDRPMSEEIKNARINARAEINRLEAEIAELEILQEEYLNELNKKYENNQE